MVVDETATSRPADRAALHVEQRLPGVQHPAAAGHPAPALPGVGGVGGLAQRLAAELQHGVGADDQRVGLLPGHGLGLGGGQQRDQLGDPRGPGRGLVDPADDDLGCQPGLAQQLQPGRGGRGEDQPAGHANRPEACQPPGPWCRGRRTASDREAQAPTGVGRGRSAPLGQRGDDGGQRSQLLGGGLAPDDAQQRAPDLVAHSGMFPCFLAGRVWRLLASTRSALVTCTRVCEGRITAST